MTEGISAVDLNLDDYRHHVWVGR